MVGLTVPMSTLPEEDVKKLFVCVCLPWTLTIFGWSKQEWREFPSKFSSNFIFFVLRFFCKSDLFHCYRLVVYFSFVDN